MEDYEKRNKFRSVIESFMDENDMDKNDSQNWAILMGAFASKVIIPNWFNKYHFIGFAGLNEEDISEDQWEEIVEMFNNRMPNWMSEEMSEWVSDTRDEWEKILKTTSEE
jgi:hypothetical protein